MKTILIVIALLAALLAVGCSEAKPAPTSTPAATPVPVATETPAPTDTPEPTVTEVPPTATATPEVSVNDWRVLYLGEVEYVIDGCNEPRATTGKQLQNCQGYAKSTAYALNQGGGDPECIKPLRAEVIDLFERVANSSELDDSIAALEDEYARLSDEIDAPCGPAGGGQ
jgi:hypothetical protein